MLFMGSCDTTALDVNGFPVNLGDLVEGTRSLEKAEGMQGIVVGMCPHGLLQVQLEETLLPTSPEPEKVLAQSCHWKLVARGIIE